MVSIHLDPMCVFWLLPLLLSVVVVWCFHCLLSSFLYLFSMFLLHVDYSFSGAKTNPFPINPVRISRCTLTLPGLSVLSCWTSFIFGVFHVLSPLTFLLPMFSTSLLPTPYIQWFQCLEHSLGKQLRRIKILSFSFWKTEFYNGSLAHFNNHVLEENVSPLWLV